MHGWPSTIGHTSQATLEILNSYTNAGGKPQFLDLLEENMMNSEFNINKIKYSGCVGQVQLFLALGIKTSLIIMWDLERGEMGCQLKIITSIIILFKKFIIHKLQWHHWSTHQWNKIFLACNIAIFLLGGQVGSQGERKGVARPGKQYLWSMGH